MAGDAGWTAAQKKQAEALAAVKVLKDKLAGQIKEHQEISALNARQAELKATRADLKK